MSKRLHHCVNVTISIDTMVNFDVDLSLTYRQTDSVNQPLYMLRYVYYEDVVVVMAGVNTLTHSLLSSRYTWHLQLLTEGRQ